MASAETSPEHLLPTMEFAVEMQCGACETAVRRALETVAGVEVVSVEADKERVLLRSGLPSQQLQQLIESTGRSAVLRGVGAPGRQLGAAVVEFYGMGGVKGVTRFVQLADRCLVDGTLDGLSPGRHGLAVCENGDLSEGCDSVGEHYNPHESRHGHPDGPDAHAGDLGNVVADASGRASFRLESRRLRLAEVIGRSLAVHAGADDGGPSAVDGNAGPKIACGIIARSAGIMQNEKKICSCSGATLWEERSQAREHSAN